MPATSRLCCCVRIRAAGIACMSGGRARADQRSAYEEAVIPLQGGDTLVANTDGVTDTADAEHIAACLRARPDIGARDLVREILHARGASTSLADRTAIAVRLDGIEEEAPLFAVASEELERAAEVVAA